MLPILLNALHEPKAQELPENTPDLDFSRGQLVKRPPLLLSLPIRNHDGDTPLMWAACKGLISAMKCLLLEGANATDTNKVGFSVLMCATSSGNVTALRMILVAIKDAARSAPHEDLLTKALTAVNSQGNSSLHIAAETGVPAVVEALLNVGAGALIDYVNAAGMTPADMAEYALSAHVYDSGDDSSNGGDKNNRRSKDAGRGYTTVAEILRRLAQKHEAKVQRELRDLEKTKEPIKAGSSRNAAVLGNKKKYHGGKATRQASPVVLSTKHDAQRDESNTHTAREQLSPSQGELVVDALADAHTGVWETVSSRGGTNLSSRGIVGTVKARTWADSAGHCTADVLQVKGRENKEEGKAQKEVAVPSGHTVSFKAAVQGTTTTVTTAPAAPQGNVSDPRKVHDRKEEQQDEDIVGSDEVKVNSRIEALSLAQLQQHLEDMHPLVPPLDLSVAHVVGRGTENLSVSQLQALEEVLGRLQQQVADQRFRLIREEALQIQAELFASKEAVTELSMRLTKLEKKCE